MALDQPGDQKSYRVLAEISGQIAEANPLVWRWLWRGSMADARTAILAAT
jgi:hypothetical protein